MMIGRVLDNRYKLEEFIGKGGMAMVYRALDQRTGHSVAVKILRPEFNGDAEFLQRFEREAAAASKMNHHNIVNLLDMGQEGECHYLVMEYVKGKTLKEIIAEKGPLPPQIAAQIAIRILSALQHAHANGIIHRDIKPQNILVHSEGHIKVADFGIARVAGTGTLSRSDSVMGSVYYFSPEQAKGGEVTEASDLYSVGVVLYEMLTGQVPFDGDTPVAVAMQQINGTPRPVRSLRPDVPPAMEKVVVKAMEKKPEMRYQSALEMAQDLHRAMQEPDGDWLNAVQDKPIPMISQVTASQRVIRKKKGKSYLPYRILGVVLCLLAAFGLVEGARHIYQTVINATEAPYVLDETEEAAIKLCTRAGLKYEIVRVSDEKSAGTVLMQTPEYETRLKKGDTVHLTVSTGPAVQPAPRLEGMTLEDARKKAEKVGFTLMVTSERALSELPLDTVVAQTPAKGEEMAYGQIIQVTLSGGSVTLPDLTGKKRDEAVQTLTQMGIRIEEIKEVLVNDRALDGIVATQQYRDEEYNALAAGDRAKLSSVAELAVYVYDAPQEGNE